MDKVNPSYSQILKTSSLVGGAEGINLLLGVVRVKFVAVLIGPIGVGLIGTYQAMQGMVGSVAGLGIKQSAVRDVAEAMGNGDEQAAGRIILSLRRICWLTGLLGAVAMAGLAVPFSQYTFGNHEYALDIALLGPAILFGNIQGGQIALIQGMRRIGDLARLNIISAVVGTLVSIILYSWLGLRGIIPSLVLLSLIQLIASWYFARRIPVSEVEMSWTESCHAIGGMVRLGLVFMWTALMAAAIAYLTRTFISQEVSLEAVGIFAAAFALSGMFVNFVLSAMGADYYPRLTAIADDHDAMTQLVNEQTEIGLLLAVPGLMGTLVLAPWIVSVLYSSEFLPAADLLQWFILGCLGRVISWPMGFIMLAQAKPLWFFMTETVFNLLHLYLIWIGLTTVGLEGVAIAFFCMYLFFIAAVYGVSRYLIDFAWSAATRRLFLLLLPFVVIAFLAGRILPIWPATVFGLVITFLASIYCLRGLVERIGSEHRIVQMSLRVPGLPWACGLSE
jgi:PST family polysaccharide transporter